MNARTFQLVEAMVARDAGGGNIDRTRSSVVGRLDVWEMLGFGTLGRLLREEGNVTP